MQLGPSEEEIIRVAIGAPLAGLVAALGLRPRLCTARRAQSIVAVAALVAFVAYGAIALAKLRAYNMGAEDLGRIDQAIWSAFDGELLVFSASEVGRPMSRLAGHVELLYVPLAALFWLWNSAGALLLAQAALVALGAIPAYRLGRQLGDESMGVAAAIAYLAHPAVGFATLSDIHGDTLAMPLLLWSIERGVAGRTRTSLGLLVLAVCGKEYVALLSVALGLYWFARQQRRLAVGAVVLGVLWLLVVVPTFHHRYRPSDFPDLTPVYYERLGSTPVEVVTTAITRPHLVVAEIATPRKLGMMAMLLAPFALTPLLGPELLLLGAPVFIPLAVSDHLDIRNHHNATLVPFLLFAALVGSRRLLGERAPMALVAASLVAHTTIGPSPFSIRSWTPGRWDYLANPHIAGRTAHDLRLDAIVATIPDHARLSVSAHLVPHLAHRSTCFAFPAPADWANIDAVVVDLIGAHAPWYRTRASELSALRDLLADRRFVLRTANDGVFVLTRPELILPPPELPTLDDLVEPELDCAPPQSASLGPLRATLLDDGSFIWTTVVDLTQPLLVLDATTREVVLSASLALAPTPWPAGLTIPPRTDIRPAQPSLARRRLRALILHEGFPALEQSWPPQPWQPDVVAGERLMCGPG